MMPRAPATAADAISVVAKRVENRDDNDDLQLVGGRQDLVSGGDGVATSSALDDGGGMILSVAVEVSLR